MSRRILAYGLLTLVSAVAIPATADTLTITPAIAHPGDPVLVTVTRTRELPRGTANGAPLQFFAARTGYQAVFAVPLDTKAEQITIEVDSVAQPRTVQIRDKTFPEASVIVEDDPPIHRSPSVTRSTPTTRRSCERPARPRESRSSHARSGGHPAR